MDKELLRKRYDSIENPPPIRDLLNLDEIKAKLWHEDLAEVSEVTGLSMPTLYSLRSGKTSNYSLSTIYAVTEYLND